VRVSYAPQDRYPGVHSLKRDSGEERMAREPQSPTPPPAPGRSRRPKRVTLNSHRKEISSFQLTGKRNEEKEGYCPMDKQARIYWTPRQTAAFPSSVHFAKETTYRRSSRSGVHRPTGVKCLRKTKGTSRGRGLRISDTYKDLTT